MNYIYDVVLNFFPWNNNFSFYEWNREDNFLTIEQIPIFRVHSTQMMDILYSKIKISSYFLKEIKNKTTTIHNVLPYCCLITDLNIVLALKFSSNGCLIEKSYLLLDEEMFIIDEASDFEIIDFKYEILDTFFEFPILTRKQKKIQSYLLEEISRLYINKAYDEIHYLYGELFGEEKSIQKKYECLIENISNNFNEHYEILYNILKMAEV